MSPKTSIRAQRRRDLARMKAKALRIYPHDKKCKSANHLAACSCPTCGNERRHFNTITIQEMRAGEAQRHALSFEL